MPTQPRLRYLTCCGCAAIAVSVGCASMPGGTDKSKPMIYEVQRLQGSITIDANWDKAAWKQVTPLELTHFMGKRPEHFPKTQARLLYDDKAIYVIFRVEDRYVRAVAKQHDDPVCRDSCVEFFFSPGTSIAAGYFNLEMNCGSTMLFHFQVTPRKDSISVKPEHIATVEAAHSLPRTVNPEIPGPITWTVEYRLPVDWLAKYHPDAQRPAPGVVWKANFFKCADDCSHPHWLTWSRVDNPYPDFHRPEFFGELAFK
jgi:hypothetical protein